MTVYFHNWDGEREKIGKINSQDEIANFVLKFLDDYHFKNRYFISAWQNSENSKELIIDFGYQNIYLVAIGEEEEC